MSLLVSISGVRGVVGESLTPEVIVKYTSAFAEYCNRGTIVIGRDGRVSGKIIGNIVSSTLLSMGCDVVALGVVPTPTIQIAVEQLNAAGGISITASHNPIEWNGLKFLGSDGLFLNALENKKLWEIAERAHRTYVGWNNLGKHTADDSFIEKHIRLVLSLPSLRKEEIQKRRFRIVVDAVNGAGSIIVPLLLRELGCEVIEMNCDASGMFAHIPEPIPENLTELCQRVTEVKADFGIAVDPDGDRLVLITEKGTPFGEEYTITSVVKFVLEHHKPQTSNLKPTIVVNLSTTRAVEDIVKQKGGEVHRAPVGEINVVQKMKEVGAIVGGEGSGGVIYPAAHYGRDAVVGIAFILQQLTEFGGTMSEFKATLPQYTMVKLKIEVRDMNLENVLQSLAAQYSNNGSINRDDGLRIDFPDSWVHLRASNTEPILRIIAEAPTKVQADNLVQQFTKEITTLS
jgi:phosphomannomutase